MRFKTIASLLTIAALTACGGDDMGASPTPTPNQPPSFGATELDFTYSEEGTAPVATLTISDETVNGVVLSLQGEDAALFTISQAGVLEFRSPPDFESPQDAGADNVYNVTVVAIDQATNTASVGITITVTDDPIAGTRFLDPIFSQTTQFATIMLPGSSGGGDLSVSMIVPAGDLASNRPLVLIAPGMDSAVTTAIAEQFAQRGYVAGVISGSAQSSSASAIALGRALNHFASPAFDAASFGVDTSAVIVAGEGEAASAASMFAVGADGFSNVAGAFTLGGGLFDLGRANPDSAPIFAAGDPRQGSAFVSAYQASGAQMQFLALGSQNSRQALDTAVTQAAPFLFANVIEGRN